MVLSLIFLFFPKLFGVEIPAENYCKNFISFNFFHDENSGYNPATAINKLRPLSLLTSPQVINVGYTTKSVWAYFKISPTKNISKNFEKCIIQLNNPLLDEINIYEVENDQLKPIATMGDKYPFKQRFFQARNFVFPVYINANHEYLLELKSTANMTVPIEIEWDEQFADENAMDNFYSTIFYVTMVVFILFGISRFIYFKNTAYLIYALYALFMLLFFFDRDGFAFKLLWPYGNAWKQKTPRFFATISMGLGVVYYAHMIKTRLKALNTTVYIYIGIVALYAMSILYLEPKYTFLPTQFIALGSPILMFLISLFPIKKDQSYAPYFACGAFSSFIGLVIYSLGGNNIIESTFYTHNAMKITAIIDFILLAIAAIKHTSNSIQKERDTAAGLETASMAAHDLHAPFSRIMKDIDIIEKANATGLNNTVQNMKKNAEIAKGMLDNLRGLGTSNCKSNKAHLAEIIDMNTEQFQVNLDYNGYVKMHTIGLTRIIDNLVNNARQATVGIPNCQYWISVSQKANLIDLAVGNTGSKIEKDDLKRVFDSFYTKGKNKGTGLGLACVAKETQRNGGYVTVESNGWASSFSKKPKVKKAQKKYSTDYVEFHVILQKGVSLESI